MHPVMFGFRCQSEAVRGRQASRRRSKRRGSVLVGASLVLPIYLVFMLGLFDYGRYLMMLHLTTNATREGARYALTHTQPVTVQNVTAGNATTDVTAIVTAAMGGQSLTGQTVQVYGSNSTGTNSGTWIDTPAGGSICVKISGTFAFVTPKMLGLPNTIAVSAQSVVRCESN
jgi:Flp pilus assembly protein TadG